MNIVEEELVEELVDQPVAPTGVVGVTDANSAGNSVFTDEQLQVLLEAGDISSEEMEQFKQQRLADELRKGIYRHKGRDVGSNLARAFSGIGAAGRQMKANKAQDNSRDMYRTLMDKLYGPKAPVSPEAAGPRPMAPMPRPAAPTAAPSPYGNMRSGPQPGPQPGPTPAGPIPMGQMPAQLRQLRPGQGQPLGDPPPRDPRAELLRRMSYIPQ